MAARRVPPLSVTQSGYGAPPRPRGGDGGLGLLVHAHAAQVLVGDLLRGVAALDRSVEESLQRVPPDRAADREADVALHRRAGAQPLVDLVVAGAAAEHHAHDLFAAVPGTGLLGEHLAVGLLVDALDLPDVDLDPEVLDL